MWTEIKHDSDLPPDGTLVDWITDTGTLTEGGKFMHGCWFLPPLHNVYAYCNPVRWRRADETRVKQAQLAELEKQKSSLQSVIDRLRAE